MNRNGSPNNNITEVYSSSSVQNNEQKHAGTHFITPQPHEESLIHTSSMSSGAIMYSPVGLQHHQNGFTGNGILRQIISNNIHPNTLVMKNANAKNMVIKEAPHGAIQITYKKMINSLPEYKTPIRILPKPTTFEPSSTYIDHKTYVTSSKHIEVSDSPSGKVFIPLSSVNIATSRISNSSLTNSTPITPSFQQSLSNGKCECASNSICLSNSIEVSSLNNRVKSVSGNSKNLNITLPRIKKSLPSNLQLCSTTERVSVQNVLTNSFSGIDSGMMSSRNSMYLATCSGANCSDFMNGIDSMHTSFNNKHSISNNEHFYGTSDKDNVPCLSKAKRTAHVSSFNGGFSDQLIDAGKTIYPSFTEINAPNKMNEEKLDYVTSINENENFEFSSTNDQFDGNYDMEDVSELISSSQSVAQLANNDMNWLSMDMDPLDSITMTSYLQNEALFGPELQSNFSTISSCEVETNGNKTPNSSLICESDKSLNINMDTNVNTNTNIYMDANLNLENNKCNHLKISTQNYRYDEALQSEETSTCSIQADLSLQTVANKKHAVETFNQTKCKNHIEIIDVSPETSTTLGGCKIIIIGSWNAKNARYSCKFGMHKVEAELIQNGVLRCYSPQLKPGTVKLCVLCNEEIVSNEVDFLVVNPSDPTEEKSLKHNGWVSISSRSLVLLLIERITAIAEIIGVEEISSLKEISEDVNCSDFEDHFVGICELLMKEKVNFEFDYNIENTMTVLHLAAALGFIKLIQLLLNWVETNPNKLIMVEACPTQYDQFSMLPIMWSSAKGHFNTTCVLHQWVESTIDQHDACGCTAIDLAKECGHKPLAEYLVRLQKKSNAMKECLSKPDGSIQVLSFSASFKSQSGKTESGEEGPVDNGCAAQTLGKTLARIQSMISDQEDDSNLQELHLDGEESLFETSPFTQRQRLKSAESNSSDDSHSPLSTTSPNHSPFNRKTLQTAEFCEFFYKAKKIEKDFAELTLTEAEQQDLLRAANVIQSAYKTYKERRKRREQEFSAAVLIQSYYRRYKQYAAFKKMQKGALLIQNQYRAHREKSKKKAKAASVIQAYYRQYRERKLGSREDVHIQNKLKQQAARKVKRYLKQTSTRFSKEIPDTFVNSISCVTSPEPS